HSATPPLKLIRLHLRADDGIRTRDPHLGKVMRYQLRYIRAQRARSSPGAKHDDSPIERACTTSSARFSSPRPCRGSVGERPLHTRKVAGSIPAGTTTVAAQVTGFSGIRVPIP